MGCGLCAAENDQPIYPVYAYRDSRTQAVIPEVHSILPFETLYARTGIQFQPSTAFISCTPTKRPGGWNRPKIFG